MITSNGTAAKAKEALQIELDKAVDLRQERMAKMVSTKNTLVKAKLKTGDTRKELDNRVKLRDGQYYQTWTCPNMKWMKRFMPEKDNPEDIYRSIR